MSCVVTIQMVLFAGMHNSLVAPVLVEAFGVEKITRSLALRQVVTGTAILLAVPLSGIVVTNR